MTSTFKTTALLLLALGAAAAPALGQDRLPRAGAPVTAVVVIETAPAARKPRSGAPVSAVTPASTELAFDATGAEWLAPTDGETGLGLCGRKYCGGASGR